MIAGAYSLHLYCERCRKFGDFSGGFHDGLVQVGKRAKDAGWRIDADYSRCLCPTCKPQGWPVVLELTPPPGEV